MVIFGFWLGFEETTNCMLWGGWCMHCKKDTIEEREFFPPKDPMDLVG